MLFPSFLIFGLLAAVGWGFGDFFGASASRKTSPKSALFWTFTLLALLWLGFGILKAAFIPLSPNSFFLCLATAFFFLVGDYFFLRATQEGKISVAAPLLALSPILTIGFAVGFLHESPSFLQVVFGLTALCGGLLVGLKEIHRRQIEKSTPLLIPAILAHGIALTMTKPLIQTLGVVSGVSWFEGLMLLFLVPFGWVYRKELKMPVLENAASAVSYFTGFFGFATALTLGLVSIAAPIANVFPVFSVALAIIVYRENMKVHQWLGFAVALVGLVGLASV